MRAAPHGAQHLGGLDLDALVAPVEDARLQQRLGAALDSLLEDTTAWELHADGSWKRVTAKKGEPSHSGQTSQMRSARRRRRSPKSGA